MKFEVKTREGKTMFCTKVKSCIPPVRVRNQMRQSGLKLFLDGKPFKGGESK